MTNEQPEQWAVELWRKACHEYGGASIADTPAEWRAIMVIQRAFEERERKLREESAEGWQKVGFLEVKLTQANETIKTINNHLPKYQAALAEVKQLKAASAEREARLVQALKDVIDPMGYLKHQAEAAGSQLSGMAYSIANDLHFVQSIARQALAQQDTAALKSREADRG